MTNLLKHLSAIWYRWWKAVWDWLRPAKRAVKPSVSNRREQMADKWELVFTPGTTTSADVVQHELTIKAESLGEVVQIVAAGELSAPVTLIENEIVTVIQVDIDNAGNRSEPSDMLTVVVTDDIPPVKPGSLAVASKREINDSDAV